jgi:hypothetical protein
MNGDYNTMKITWDTDVNAPCCPGQIVNDAGKTILIQCDYDFPGVAVTFGWSLVNIQKCDCGEISNIDALGEETFVCSHCDQHMSICDHGGTDGTIDCPECGLTAIEFIEASRDFLENNDGATADDPGYF